MWHYWFQKKKKSAVEDIPNKNFQFKRGARDSGLQSFRITVRGPERSWICMNQGETATIMFMLPLIERKSQFFLPLDLTSARYLVLADIPWQTIINSWIYSKIRHEAETCWTPADHLQLQLTWGAVCRISHLSRFDLPNSGLFQKAAISINHL